MMAIAAIERALASAVLTKTLVVVESRGAMASELRSEQVALGRVLSNLHRVLLERWNGLDLDVIRLYGVGSTEPGIRCLRAEQRDWPEVEGSLIVGSDPSGFIYLERPTGEIWTLDTDGGDEEVVAENIDALFWKHVFGSDAAVFGGEEWAERLLRAGVSIPQ